MNEQNETKIWNAINKITEVLKGHTEQMELLGEFMKTQKEFDVAVDKALDDLGR